jgi:hypothetical protein
VVRGSTGRAMSELRHVVSPRWIHHALTSTAWHNYFAYYYPLSQRTPYNQFDTAMATMTQKDCTVAPELASGELEFTLQIQISGRSLYGENNLQLSVPLLWTGKKK